MICIKQLSCIFINLRITYYLIINIRHIFF